MKSFKLMANSMVFDKLFVGLFPKRIRSSSI